MFWSSNWWPCFAGCLSLTSLEIFVSYVCHLISLSLQRQKKCGQICEWGLILSTWAWNCFLFSCLTTKKSFLTVIVYHLLLKSISLNPSLSSSHFLIGQRQLIWSRRKSSLKTLDRKVRFSFILSNGLCRVLTLPGVMISSLGRVPVPILVQFLLFKGGRNPVLKIGIISTMLSRSLQSLSVFTKMQDCRKIFANHRCRSNS